MAFISFHPIQRALGPMASVCGWFIQSTAKLIQNGTERLTVKMILSQHKIEMGPLDGGSISQIPTTPCTNLMTASGQFLTKM